METPNDVLDALKEELGISSDYRLAKELGISRTAISNYRSGRNTFNDDLALMAAEILGLSPALILCICALERARGKKTEDAWIRAVKVLSQNRKEGLP